jgi:glyoxalase family protein
MLNQVNGIHHVTALARDPGENIGFYTGILGLRLVKKTVNFDAPDVYHLYYGDELGQPGTILTFFPFPDATRGSRGAGEVSAVAFLAPAGSLEFWSGHLSRHGIHFDGPITRFGERSIAFQDPDGMRVELVFSENAESRERYWTGSAIGRGDALRRLRGVTLQLRDSGRTADLLTGPLGFRPGGSEGILIRFLAGEGAAESAVDIERSPDAPRARQSAGSVHHVAWRTDSVETQRQWRERLTEGGLQVTEVIDRNYFHSIYFREPGGVLFEIATDPPGFTVDESPGELGTGLKLPSWLEPQRGRIERTLPPVRSGGTVYGL